MSFEKLKIYLLVAKPGIVSGNVITTAAGFFLASKGKVDGNILMAVLGGISLVVASGGVFNNCIDREIDRQMLRTCRRPLAQGLMSLKSAIFYGTILALTGLTSLWAVSNWLAVFIVLLGLMIYVVMYSLYLKRRSIYSTLIGSLAGATPPMAGYCAVSGRFDLGALLLLVIFSLWQLPHCYAIAVYRFDDYHAASIPIMPVRQGIAAAKTPMIGYILAFLAATLMLTFTGYTGYWTMAVSIISSLSWLYLVCLECKSKDERLWAKKLYLFSLLTILLISIVISIDCI